MKHTCALVGSELCKLCAEEAGGEPMKKTVEGLRREVSLHLRIKSATTAQLSVLIDFFDAPMLRTHYAAVLREARAELKRKDGL